MTEDQYVNLVLEATGKTERELPRFRILGLRTQALELFAKRISTQPGYKGMQKDFPATPTAGRLDLTTIADMLFDMDRATVRVSATNVLLIPVDLPSTLAKGGLIGDEVYYAREGNELVFRATNGTLDSYATALKIKANFIPTLATVPNEYKGALAEVGGELALAPATHPEMTEVSR